ncbi:DUF4861 domain-containing protein [Dysgonamonadaceae bacterium]|nr:DUF4861 domain-containing protein [Dysgonamonadaceae bacterium]
MRKKYLGLLPFVIFCCGIIHAQRIEVKNSSIHDLYDYVVEIPIEKLNLKQANYVIVTNKGQELPLEVVADINGNQKAIFPVDFFPAHTTLTFTIKKGFANNYPKRTYAELAHKIGGKFEGKKYVGDFSWVKTNYLRVPDGFTDHAYYIKYEGPGWESDKVAFRFYLDWRNGIDVFAKKTPQIVLPFVGVDGYDSYHSMAVWGMDNMKVGNTLGLGSIATWDSNKAVRVEKRDSVICLIPTDGKIRSQVFTTYYGWDTNGIKCNLQSLITIDAGSRASRMELKADKNIDNIATGIIKDNNAELIIPKQTSGEWSYIATFGKQSLNNDMMGLAVFYKTKQLVKITEDNLNHVIILKPINGQVEYYFMPTWELDWEPVKDKAAFEKCIDEVLNRLNNPISYAIHP